MNLKKKEILSAAIFLNLVGLCLMIPILYKGFEFFQVRNWNKIYCTIEKSQSFSQRNPGTGGRPIRRDVSSIIVTKYIHKIKLPNGSFFFLESYKAYENEFPIYFDPEDQMNYKAIETNDSLLNVILFAIGIVMIFYTNYKAGYFYEKADDLENYEHKRNRRLRRRR